MVSMDSIPNLSSLLRFPHCRWCLLGKRVSLYRHRLQSSDQILQTENIIRNHEYTDWEARGGAHAPCKREENRNELKTKKRGGMDFVELVCFLPFTPLIIRKKSPPWQKEKTETAWERNVVGIIPRLRVPSSVTKPTARLVSGGMRGRGETCYVITKEHNAHTGWNETSRSLISNRNASVALLKLITNVLKKIKIKHD
jgi:hypothetical protein